MGVILFIKAALFEERLFCCVLPAGNTMELHT